MPAGIYIFQRMAACVMSGMRAAWDRCRVLAGILACGWLVTGTTSMQPD